MNLFWNVFCYKIGVRMKEDIQFLFDVFFDELDDLDRNSRTVLIEYLTKRDDVLSHSKKVTYYALKIFEAFEKQDKIFENKKEDLFLASLFHDIGKLQIPTEILEKPGKLTKEEFDIMKKHAEFSVDILRKFSLFHHILPFITYHHERYDGRGYPYGLSGEEIPLISRIMAVADSFDAMTTDRVYSRAHDADYAIQELKDNKGTQFDSNVVDAFVELFEKEKIVVGWIF